MNIVHNLLWWTMYIDRWPAQPIAAGNRHIGGHVFRCFVVDNVYLLTVSPV